MDVAGCVGLVAGELFHNNWISGVEMIDCQEEGGHVREGDLHGPLLRVSASWARNKVDKSQESSAQNNNTPTKCENLTFKTYRSVNGRRANRGHDPSGPTADWTGIVKRNRKKNGSMRTTRETSRERAMVKVR